MLIINADDFGKSAVATDNTILSYQQCLITSASAMVYMKDSQRAAEAALAAGMDTGLHLNLTLPFDGQNIPSRLMDYQIPIINYFQRSKWNQAIYNPFLNKKFDYVYKAQHDEYCRLFNMKPARLDGHHHMHLSMNMLFGHFLPSGMMVRRTHSFFPGEKNVANRLYRWFINKYLTRHFYCTDSFFSLEPIGDIDRIEKIIRIAITLNVEVMLHPEQINTFEFTQSIQYQRLIAGVPKGTYRLLSRIN